MKTNSTLVRKSVRWALSAAVFVTALPAFAQQPAKQGKAGARVQMELPAGAEAMSLLGQPLVSKPPAGEAKQRLEAELAAAQREFDASAAENAAKAKGGGRDTIHRVPTTGEGLPASGPAGGTKSGTNAGKMPAVPASADAYIWLGRRTAYLGRFREAIAIFSRGIEAHPRDARLYRHRGHRWISLREFDRAIADLERAAKLVAGRPDEVEPDGRPNARNTPIGTTNSNIYYHLGLAHYLKGDFPRALAAYQHCMKFSGNPDRLVSTSHWLYMTLRRMGRDAEAAKVLEPITPQMDIIENQSYHRLLLLYKGGLTPEELLGRATDGNDPPTIGYGVANWHYYNGRRDAALELWRKIVEGDAWAAFGYIAAEADLARAK